MEVSEKLTFCFDTLNCREWLIEYDCILYEMMNVCAKRNGIMVQSSQLEKKHVTLSVSSKKNLRLLLQGRHVGRGGAHSYKSVIRKVEGEIPIFKGNIWKNMQTYIYFELFWYILLECTKEWKSGYYLYRMWSFPCPNQLRIAKSAPVLVQHVKNTNDSDADSAPTSVAAACALSQDNLPESERKVLSTGSFSARTGAISQQSDISDMETWPGFSAVFGIFSSFVYDCISNKPVNSGPICWFWVG